MLNSFLEFRRRYWRNRKCRFLCVVLRITHLIYWKVPTADSHCIPDRLSLFQCKLGALTMKIRMFAYKRLCDSVKANKKC